MKRIALWMVFLLLGLIPPLYAETLGDHIQKLIQKNLPRADVGIVLMNAQNSQILYEKNAYQLYTPASNIKIFTAAAALYYLKPYYRFKTTLSLNRKLIKGKTIRGNVYVTFSGDPTLTAQHLKQFFRDLKKAGVRRIQKNIVLDDFRFQKPNYPAGISFEDLNWYYAAPISAVIINENAIPVSIRASKTLGKRPHIRLLGPLRHYVSMTNKVQTSTKAYAKSLCEFQASVNDRNHMTFYGCWKVGAKRSVERVAVKNPFLLAKRIIKAALKQNGIKLSGTIRSGITPNKLTVIAAHTSPGLGKLTKVMLRESDNMIADTLLKTLGYYYLGKGSFKGGVYALKKILSRYTALDFATMYLDDGSGSRYNLIAPKQMAQLLYVIYHTPQLKKFFIEALPDAGKNGTLRHRMRVFDVADNVHAKTGTMHDVSALSGFATSLDKHKLIFSIMINHVAGGIKKAKQLENQIASAFVRYPVVA